MRASREHPGQWSLRWEARGGDGAAWKLGFEFRYSGPEQIHVKPVAAHLDDLEKARQEVSVIYVPPFSGIGVNETRYDRPYQDMLVGQGKGGDILRNLLLEVAEKRAGADWEKLEGIIEEVFHYRLLRPVYGGAPYIACQYLKGIPPGRSLGGLPPLDVSTTGSGFHQLLLILAFMFARPSSLILLAESAHGIVYLEGDNRNMPDREISADGLTILRWERYEAESYLIHPSALERFVTQEKGELFASAALRYLRDQLPPAFFKDPLQSSSFLRSEPVSKTLLPEFLKQADLSTEITKSDYFLIAREMRKPEIPQEVLDKLAEIHQVIETNHASTR